MCGMCCGKISYLYLTDVVRHAIMGVCKNECGVLLLRITLLLEEKAIKLCYQEFRGLGIIVVRLFILRFAFIRRPEALTPEPLSDATIRESTGERPVSPNKNKRMSVTRREKNIPRPKLLELANDCDHLLKHEWPAGHVDMSTPSWRTGQGAL